MLKSIGLFAPHLRGKKGLLVAVFLLGLAGSAVGLATPLLGKAFIDAVTERGDFSIVPWIALALVGLALADLVFGTITRVVHTKLSSEVLMEMRERIFSHCLNSPLASLERFRHGDLLSRFGTDVAQIQTLLVDGALGFLQNVIFLVVAASILFHLSAKLALWSFLGILIALVVTTAFRRPIEKGTRGIRELMAGISHFLAERLGALRAVRLHGTQQEDQQRFVKHNAGLVRKLLRFQALDAAATGLPGIMLTVALAYIYFLGGGLLESGEITLGTFVAFLLYQSRLYGPARSLLGLVRNLQEVRVSLDRVLEVLEGEATGAAPHHQDNRQGKGIRLENVSFAYQDNPPVLSGVNLTIAPGRRVAIFGTSGAGKSTLVQLLFGLRHLQQGAICSGQGKLGYAGNEPFLLHASVEENLRYGNPRASDDELIDAARLASAHDFIEALPQGYQTVIGGRGQSLSDGQRQRLGLARLILNRPEILVLDEAFSALDPETEGVVQRNLWDRFHDRTILVITHRLEDLHVYDHLYLLRDGKLQQVQERELRMALGAGGEGTVAADAGASLPAEDSTGRLAREPRRSFA